jgi:uncharacterized membrane protein YfcA
MVPGPLAGVGHLSSSRDLLVVLAGIGAGIFNGIAGGGTLVSFPVLLALGYPALTANVTSTVGIWPGYLGSVAGFNAEIADQRARVIQLMPIAIGGAVVGAVLLLTTSSQSFSRAAPWLVLTASFLFAIQPVLSRRLSNRRDQRLHRAILIVGIAVASVYGGYFGAGMGVLLLAVLGIALPDTLARTSGLRSMLSVVVNGVAALVFVIHARLVWDVVGLLALGSLIGGFVGARIARRVPTLALRIIVVLIGTATGIRLLVG